MTLTTYADIEQRSEEWYAARRGIVTASTVGRLLTIGPPDAISVTCPACKAESNHPCLNVARKIPSPIKTLHTERTKAASELPDAITVADNETSRGIITTLAAERIAGWTEETRMTGDMIRGVEMEPFARDHYSAHYQQAEQVGFMRWDDDGWSLGLSPDGLVGIDGGLEVKCPRAKTHVAWTLADQVPSQHMAQVQAALMVTARDWWDFASYCSGLSMFVKRVTPDPVWFEAIEAATRAAETAIAQVVTDYEAKTNGLPLTERIDLNNLGLVF